MRRTASEVLRSLEMRVARLERGASGVRIGSKQAMMAPTVYMDDPSDRGELKALVVVKKEISSKGLTLPRGFDYEMVDEFHLSTEPHDQIGPVYQVVVTTATDVDGRGRARHTGSFFVLVEGARVIKVSERPMNDLVNVATRRPMSEISMPPTNTRGWRGSRSARFERLGSVSRDLASSLRAAAKNIGLNSFDGTENLIEKALKENIEEIFGMDIDDVKDFKVERSVKISAYEFAVQLKLKPFTGRAVTKSMGIEYYENHNMVTIDQISRMPRGQGSGNMKDFLSGPARSRGDERNR